jgi:GntR family transcriptional regulator
MQAEDILRRLIRSREYRDGKLLPPETTIAASMNISRSTIRAAIDRLAREGLLIRRRGFGTQVAPPRAHSSRFEAWDSFSREMAEKGERVEEFHFSVRSRRAPISVCHAFGLDEDSSLLSMSRTRGFNGEPVVHFQSWFHPRLGLTGEEDFGKPLYSLFYEHCHVQPEHSYETITAIAADNHLAKHLRVKPGSPLLRRLRRVLDEASRPIEFALNHYRSDRFEYTLHLQRNNR